MRFIVMFVSAVCVLILTESYYGQKRIFLFALWAVYQAQKLLLLIGCLVFPLTVIGLPRGFFSYKF